MGTRIKDIVECYVVRIYRRDTKDAFRAEGVVERPEKEAVKVFHSARELLEGLDFPAGEPAGPRKKRAIGRRG